MSYISKFNGIVLLICLLSCPVIAGEGPAAADADIETEFAVTQPPKAVAAAVAPAPAKTNMPQVESSPAPVAAPAPQPAAAPAHAPVAAAPVAVQVPVAAPAPVAPAAQVTNIVVGTTAAVDSRYKDLEARYQELQQAMAAASGKIREMTPTNRLAKIGELERKAFAYDSLHIKLQLKDEAITALNRELAAALSLAESQKVTIIKLTAATNEMALAAIAMQKELDPLKKALSLVQRGKYEYYEVKAGDTCETIAAKVTVYGDAKKGILIRQANHGNIKDLDALIPGETLIIPRFVTGKANEL